MKVRMVMATALVLVALLALPMIAGAQETDPVSVIEAMAEYLAAWDLDGVISMYADDIVVTVTPGANGPPDVYTGKDEVRGWLESFNDQNFKVEYEIVSVEGDTVTLAVQTWTDATRQLGIAPIAGTEVHIIRDGKVQSYTWTMSEESMAAYAAAMAALPETGGGAFPIQELMLVLGGLSVAGGLVADRLRRRRQ